jgi:hypothetical protein
MLLARLRARLPTLVPGAVLFGASYLFRLPPLMNARSTNSDAAVVGLQAMHMLRGELSPFLWGSGYQTSADAAVAAAFFVALGKTPLVLMLSSLTLHVVATLLVFATLRRRFAPWTAALLTSPLVVSPSSVHSYALYPPRQLSLTLALAAFWAIDRGSRERPRWLALGGLLAGLAVSADPYPLVLLPIAALFALLRAAPRAARHARDATSTSTSTSGARGSVSGALRGATAALPFVLGAAAGLAPFALVHALPRAQSGQMTFRLEGAARHAKLLWDECLPWALSYKVYYAHHVMDYLPWSAPPAFRAVGILGALLVAGVVLYALVAMRESRTPWRVRSLGFAAALVFPLTLVAFVFSVMAMDHFSMRYLAVLTLMLPFAAAPAAHALGARRFLPVFLPHLVASAIAGWVGYGPFVHGLVPVRETPELADDYALLDALHARGVTYATADYWASYRLTLLSNERLVVVPTNPAEDRYPPYRRAFAAAPVYAYVFDPARSRESLAAAEASLPSASSSIETLHAGALTAFIVTRRPE